VSLSPVLITDIQGWEEKLERNVSIRRKNILLRNNRFSSFLRLFIIEFGAEIHPAIVPMSQLFF
jgi:hypothetical protein